MSKKPIVFDEPLRLAILKQAQELNVPAFCTPLWRSVHGKKKEG